MNRPSNFPAKLLQEFVEQHADHYEGGHLSPCEFYWRGQEVGFFELLGLVAKETRDLIAEDHYGQEVL